MGGAIVVWQSHNILISLILGAAMVNNVSINKLLCKAAATFALFAVATESHAIPAFARQVGVACSACHAQHFPVLNEDGRAFKAGGFTLMSKNPKIEAEGL